MSLGPGYPSDTDYKLFKTRWAFAIDVSESK